MSDLTNHTETRVVFLLIRGMVRIHQTTQDNSFVFSRAPSSPMLQQSRSKPPTLNSPSLSLLHARMVMVRKKCYKPFQHLLSRRAPSPRPLPPTALRWFSARGGELQAGSKPAPPAGVSAWPLREVGSSVPHPKALSRLKQDKQDPCGTRSTMPAPPRKLALRAQGAIRGRGSTREGSGVGATKPTSSGRAVSARRSPALARRTTAAALRTDVSGPSTAFAVSPTASPIPTAFTWSPTTRTTSLTETTTGQPKSVETSVVEASITRQARTSGR